MRRILILFAVVITALLIARFFPEKNIDERTVGPQVTESETVAVTRPQTTHDKKDARTVSLPSTMDAVDSGVREIQLGDGLGLNEAMELLGISDMQERLTAWSEARGYPPSDATGISTLEQPYDQYDDVTLRAFAENEDMWAQQFLAQRLEKNRPAEALDWYRKAAINGSLYAMDRVTALYRRLGRTRVDGNNVDETLKQQVYAIKDSVESLDEMSFAWSVVSTMAGGDPSRTNVVAQRLSRNFDDATLERACGMAASLYDDMSAVRAQRDLGDFERSPPPFLLGNRDELSGTVCNAAPTTPYLDFSDCEEVSAVTSGIGSRLLVCNDQQ